MPNLRLNIVGTTRERSVTDRPRPDRSSRGHSRPLSWRSVSCGRPLPPLARGTAPEPSLSGAASACAAATPSRRPGVDPIQASGIRPVSARPSPGAPESWTAAARRSPRLRDLARDRGLDPQRMGRAIPVLATLRKIDTRSAESSLDRSGELVRRAAGGRPRGVRRAGRAVRADRARDLPAAAGQSERGAGADSGGLPPRPAAARPAPRARAVRRLAAAGRGPDGDQPRHAPGRAAERRDRASSKGPAARATTRSTS